MTGIVGKTVYLLGAGASVHTGAPLLRDFLVAARHLYESRQNLFKRDSFERVFEWTNHLKSSSYYVEVDIDNLENVFSLLEMGAQIGVEGTGECVEDLKLLTLITLEESCLLERGPQGKVRPDGAYKDFCTTLDEHNESRLRQLPTSDRPNSRDSIISFNYDLMLDYAMSHHNIAADYRLKTNSSQHPDSYKLLKLHGSINWTYCSECLNRGIDHERDFQFVEGGQRTRTPFVSQIISRRKCKECEGPLQIMLIPPTWSKRVKDHPISNVWKEAMEEIQSAFQIVIIGYSMPQTDTFLNYLLALALGENSNLHRVVVVNSDETEDFKIRYKQVFSRSLDSRGRLVFVSETFKKFVLGDTFKRIATSI